MMKRARLGWILLVSMLGAACGSASGTQDDPMFTDDAGDAAVDTGALPSDVTVPSLDVPSLDRGPISNDLPSTGDTGSVSRPDTGTVSRPDTGTTIPVDTGSVSRPDTGSVPPVDTGSGLTGICPSSCATAANCDSCWRAGETRIGQYCCEGAVCIYHGAGEACGGTPVPDAGGGGSDGFSFDLGGGGGSDGFSFDLGGGGSTDVGFSTDTGGGGTTTDSGTTTCPSTCSSSAECRACGRTLCVLGRCLL